MTTATMERENTTTMSEEHAAVVKAAEECIANAVEKRVVDGVDVEITYAHEDDMRVSDREIKAYIDRGNTTHQNTIVTGLKLAVDGEEIGITYDLAPRPFERIRRITGYLVGTLDRFNDAKRAEEHDRVKHSVTSIPSCCQGR